MWKILKDTDLGVRKTLLCPGSAFSIGLTFVVSFNLSQLFICPTQNEDDDACPAYSDLMLSKQHVVGNDRDREANILPTNKSRTRVWRVMVQPRESCVQCGHGPLCSLWGRNGVSFTGSVLQGGGFQKG